MTEIWNVFFLLNMKGENRDEPEKPFEGFEIGNKIASCGVLLLLLFIEKLSNVCVCMLAEVDVQYLLGCLEQIHNPNCLCIENCMRFKQL